MSQKQLENRINRLSKNLKKGDSFELLYNGRCIATYTFTEWSADAKTPIDWLRECIAFLITLKDRNINNCSILYSKP